MTPRDWACLPFFLLGCWTVLDAVAEFFYQRQRRREIATNPISRLPRR